MNKIICTVVEGNDNVKVVGVKFEDVYFPIPKLSLINVEEVELEDGTNRITLASQVDCMNTEDLMLNILIASLDLMSIGANRDKRIVDTLMGLLKYSYFNDIIAYNAFIKIYKDYDSFIRSTDKDKCVRDIKMVVNAIRSIDILDPQIVHVQPSKLSKFPIIGDGDIVGYLTYLPYTIVPDPVFVFMYEVHDPKKVSQYLENTINLIKSAKGQYKSYQEDIARINKTVLRYIDKLNK